MPGRRMVRLTARFPEHEQRGHIIALRRTFTRPLLEQFIAFAMRVTEEQGRVSEILRHAGAEGIELMVDQVKTVEAVGPRRFVHDVLAATPAALPMLLPLLSSPKWHEVRHGAELLGRLGLPEAVEPLRAAATHPDERVRKAAIEALGGFHTQAVIEPLRRALDDPAPLARASAAHALSQRHSPGLALPILVALESEKDPLAWEALVVAVARIDSFEAVSGLVEIALDKRPLFHTGRPKPQRMTVVLPCGRRGPHQPVAVSSVWQLKLMLKCAGPPRKRSRSLPRVNPQSLHVEIEVVIDPEPDDTPGVHLGSREGVDGLSVHHEGHRIPPDFEAELIGD